MKNIGIFLSENFHFLEVKFSVYLNRHVFVMLRPVTISIQYVKPLISVLFRPVTRSFILYVKPFF